MYQKISLCLFILVTLTRVSGQSIQAEFAQVDRIVVVGDIHGDMEQALAVLQSADLIDDRRRWIGEETHLVQLGDIPDRGPDTKDIIEYFKRLGREAAKAGGQVHNLIGNHDAMNMQGDLRYVHEGEYKAFSSRNSKRKLDILYEDTVSQIKRSNPEEEWPEFNRDHKQAWLKDKPPGYVEHRLQWLPDGAFGKWTLSNNAVLKIGDSLFVHAGIGPADVNLSIEEINTQIRDTLEKMDVSKETIVRRENGPLWYRGLAQNPERAEEAHVNQVLEAFGVNRIVIGHTPTPGVIVPRFDGKVILADVGLSAHYGANLACLEIKRWKNLRHPPGQTHRATPVQQRRLCSVPGADCSSGKRQPAHSSLVGPIEAGAGEVGEAALSMALPYG